MALKFLVDPHAAPPKLGDRQEFRPPQIDGAPQMPVYPPEALEVLAPPASVVVRITIDRDGRVSEIEDSPVMASTPGPLAPYFRASVVRAVRRWQFSPGRIEQYMDGPDLDRDGQPDYTRAVSTDPVDVWYDLRFDFQIEQGKGVVRSSAN